MPTTPTVFSSSALLAAALLCLLPWFAAGQLPSEAAQRAEQSTYVAISGKTDPGAIPDYEAWRATFHILAAVDRGEFAALKERLLFPPKDAERIYAEARLQKTRDNACYAQQARIKEDLQAAKAKRDRILAALEEIVLECRGAVLSSSERLLQTLSDDGRHALTAYVEERRGQVEMMIHKSQLESYKLPR